MSGSWPTICVPPGKVKDFAPYASKIKASGVDTVLTDNWGPHLSPLIKLGKDAGLDVIYYTLNANNIGVIGSIGKATYIPSIMKSPCAKLITRMTPKITLRPTHINP